MDMSNVNIIFARVDDECANDPVQQSLMKMTIATTGIGIRFWTVAKTLENIQKAAPSQKIFIVTRTPKEMLTLIEGGVPIKEVNLGHMHSAPGKRKYLGNFIYVDNQDEYELNKIKENQVHVYAQISSDDRKVIMR